MRAAKVQMRPRSHLSHHKGIHQAFLVHGLSLSSIPVNHTVSQCPSSILLVSGEWNIETEAFIHVRFTLKTTTPKYYARNEISCRTPNLILNGRTTTSHREYNTRARETTHRKKRGICISRRRATQVRDTCRRKKGERGGKRHPRENTRPESYKESKVQVQPQTLPPALRPAIRRFHSTRRKVGPIWTAGSCVMSSCGVRSTPH